MVSEERQGEGNTEKREQQGAGALDIPEVKRIKFSVDTISLYVLFRAKHRKDVRHEETRGDWYFQRKQHLKDDESEGKKTKGEDYKENKRNFVRSKGETEKGRGRRKRPFNAGEKYNEINTNHGNR